MRWGGYPELGTMGPEVDGKFRPGEIEALLTALRDAEKRAPRANDDF